MVSPTALVLRYREYRLLFYRWRYSTTLIRKVALAVGFACLIGLCARITIPLPFTPVPITLQTYAVLLSGTLLSHIWGSLSILIYLLLGILGIGWFAGGKSGISVILGPTGGYLLGFVFAAYFIGYYSEKYIRLRKLKGQIIIMFIASLIIYFFGCIGLFLFLAQTQEKSLFLLLVDTFIKGVLPFIPGDILKAVLAATSASILLPKEPYNSEIFQDKYK